MSDIGRPAGEPPFSTLEVNLRGEYSTLEVKPAKPHDPFSSITAPKENVTEPSLSDTRDHWWKRYWLIILVASILVTGGVIGGAVGGTMASRKESNKTEDVDGSLTTSSYRPTNTTLSTGSQATSLGSLTTSAASTTTSWPSTKPTATPGANDIPSDPVYVGRGEDDGQKFHVAFAVDGTRNDSCNYGIIPVPEPDNPCSHPFLLPNGFSYSWEGCGGGTWMTWKNPSSNDPSYHTLHKGACEYQPKTFKCPDMDISATWLCRNSSKSQ